MEEKTLQELNEEYVGLTQEIKTQKEELKKAKDAKTQAESELDEAQKQYDEAKEKYDIQKKAFETAKASGFSDDAIKPLKDELDIAESNMNSYKGLVERKEQILTDTSKNFDTINNSLKKQSDRMDLILVSFGGNETINKALVNELEIDYGEMIEEKESQRAKIDEIKTKINDDPKMQANVADLHKLLEDFKIAKENVTPDTVDSLSTMAKQIKAKRAAISRNIRKYMGKGGKISSEEIDAMTTARDEKGRFVIPELDRRAASIDLEIGSLMHQKDEIINSMAITLEMSQNLENGTQEYQTLISDIQILDQEIQNAKNEKQKSEEILSKIPEERKSLEEELAKIGTDIDIEQIEKLKKDKADIEAEKVEMVDNPEIADIQRQIAELEAKIASGSKIKVETEEYKLAQKQLEEAREAYENEKILPSVRYKKRSGDVIIDNPQYKNLEAKLDQLKNEEKTIRDRVENNNPELKELKDEYSEQTKDIDQILDELDETRDSKDNLKKEAMKDYVSEELYSGLKQEENDLDETDEAKAFNEYKDAELELRKAMITLQKDPTEDNKKILLEAMKKYQDATKAFQEELELVSGYVAKPTNEAMHNYLLGVLKNEDARDEGYDSNNVSNRIKILEAQRKKGVEKYEISFLKDSTEELDNILDKLLKGENVTQEEIDKAVKEQADSIDNFDDPEDVKDVLQGTGFPAPQGKPSLFSRIFSKKWPKLEPKYNFGDNEPTEKYEAFMEASDKLEQLEQDRDYAIKSRNDTQRKLETKLEEALTSEDKGKIKVLSDEIDRIKNEMSLIPSQLNKTRLEELKNALQTAQEKLDKTPQYRETEDVDKMRQSVKELKDKKAKTPAKIEDPNKKADKERRAKEKQDKIDELSNGGVDTAKVSSLKQRLAKLLDLENSEKEKINNAEETINKKSPVLEEKKRKVSVLEVARSRMKNIKNLIKIKDSNKISDRRSGAIAENLANATKEALRNEDKEQDDDAR